MEHDAEGIRRTLAEYCQLLDDGRFDEWADLFATDAVYDIPGSPIKTREKIRTWIEAASAHGTAAKHVTLNSVIEVGARPRWR